MTTVSTAQVGLTRNLPAFSRVLEVAALCQAEQTDFTAVSNDAQVPRTTVHEYLQTLEDTLMIHRLEPWGVARKLQSLVEEGKTRRHLQVYLRPRRKLADFPKIELLPYGERRLYCKKDRIL